MKDWIAGLLATLGTLLVLAGATITVFTTLAPSNSEPDSSGSKVARWMRNLKGPDRLLLWGVILLVIGAIAAGALSFDIELSAGSK